MFAMKILNKSENKELAFKKTVNNLIDYIFNKINFKDSKMIQDNTSIEIVHGKEESSNNKDDIVIELLIRKHLVINSSEFNDNFKLDKHLSKIKEFCKHAKEIEDLQYIPINMRS